VRARNFPLTTELREVLEQQLARSREVEKASGIVIARLFHHAGGTPIKDFRSAWKSACKRAGLMGRISSDFRRGAVHNLERSHVPRSAAMKTVGHKTESKSLVCRGRISSVLAAVVESCRLPIGGWIGKLAYCRTMFGRVSG